MKPTEVLMKEHRLIEKILAVLDRLASDAAHGKGLDRQRALDVLVFLRQFADRCHHGKEEQHLFPRLGLHGFGPETGPVAVMLHEHEQGRAHIREMSSALEEIEADRALERFAQAARAYTMLLAGHIQKEDNVLFRLVDQVFTAEDQRIVAEGFERVEEVDMGPGTHEKLHALADRIVAGAGS